MTNKPIIIGLTGNIATGKSVVGHMIANSGGLDIDADVVANRMLYPMGPAYHAVLDVFGEKIINNDGLISRWKLGEIVFSNPEKLAKLETLIHPAVTKAIEKRIKRTSQPLVVIEAIKLLESDLVDICDTIWVSDASQAHQMERLKQARKMTREAARSRIESQSSQSEKLERSDVVINTEGSFKNTWEQVQDAVNDKININLISYPPERKGLGDWDFPDVSCLSEACLEDFCQAYGSQTKPDLFTTLGTELVLPFIRSKQLEGLLTWNNWNFTAVVKHWLVRKKEDPTADILMNAYQQRVLSQQGEVILFAEQMRLKNTLNLEKFGFKQVKISQIPYPAWQEVAEKVAKAPDLDVWIKYLSQPFEINEDLQNLE